VPAFGANIGAADTMASTLATDAASAAAKAWAQAQICPAQCPPQYVAASAGGSHIVLSAQIAPGVAIAVATHDWQAFVYCTPAGVTPDLKGMLDKALKKKLDEEYQERARELERELDKHMTRT
jgi:hypothetical protein